MDGRMPIHKEVNTLPELAVKIIVLILTIALAVGVTKGLYNHIYNGANTVTTKIDGSWN